MIEIKNKCLEEYCKNNCFSEDEMNDEEFLRVIETTFDYNRFKISWEIRKTWKVVLDEIIEKKNVIKSWINRGE